METDALLSLPFLRVLSKNVKAASYVYQAGILLLGCTRRDSVAVLEASRGKTSRHWT